MTANHTYNKRELIESFTKGDEAAFGKLFQLHHQRIGAFIKRFGVSGPLLEELVQDIFIKLWIHRQKVAEVDDFSAYLSAIARNHMFNYLKKTGRELARHNQWEMNSLQDKWHHPGADEDHYKSLLDNAIKRLPAQQHRVYILSREEGLPHAQIASYLGISLETVKKHMVLALKAIRQELMNSRDRVKLSILLFWFF